MPSFEFFKNLGISFIILFLSTLMSFVFYDINVRSENIIMIYLIGVLFIVMETKKFIWGISATLLSIVTFNFFFTQPTYSLAIDDPSYVITIIVFLIVSFITGSLVNKMQQHAKEAKYNEQQTYALYQISKNYLTISGIDNIIAHNINSLYNYQKIKSVVYYFDEVTKKLQVYQSDEFVNAEQSDESLAKWCYDNVCDCGYGTAFYEQSKWMYRPLRKNNQALGVYAIFDQPNLDAEKEMFINTMISQMVLATEREMLYIQQEQNKIDIEKEKLRNNLLRSISHDLRTPLTSIAGSSSLIIQNYDNLDDKTVLNLVTSIGSDAIWLNQLVENLLNMTRIQDGKLLLKQQKEVVDDIICEAIARCESRKEHHTIRAKLPDDVILIEMDGKLIVQVLINFIDNAIKHTSDASIIEIGFYIDNHMACFEVSDNGDGIDEQIMDTLFDSFVTTKSDRSDSKRGVGLGLSICKSIIEAHQGTIYAHNKTTSQGAVFGFQLPLEKKKED